MKLKILNFDKEFGNLPVVSSPAFIYRNKTFHRDGIFSEQIFGPVNDYQCQCGKLKGRANENLICDCCGVKVTSSEMRRKTFARIVIPDIIYVVNPLIIDILDNLNFSSISFKVSKVINGKMLIKEENGNIVQCQRNDKEAMTGPEAFKYILYPYLLKHEEDFDDFGEEYQDQIFIHSIPVIPPDARPMMQSSKDEKQFFSDEINEKYENILRELFDIQYAPFIFSNNHVTMQTKVNVLFKTLMGKFEKKSGFLRSHVLGKRIDYSGRAVITVDGSNMPLGFCKIPFEIAKEIYKPQIIQPIANAMGVNPLKVLNNYYKPEMKPHLLKVLKEMFIGTFVFLNRQPTLHRPSFQSAKIFDIIEDDVIVIHPLITDSYNADFDGDQMAIYVPQTIALKDAAEKMWVDSNRRLPSNGSITYTFKQDEIMGLNKITDESESAKCDYLGEVSTEARVALFKKILPESYWANVDLFKKFNFQLTKKVIHNFIDYAEKTIDVYVWLTMIDLLCKEGFHNSFGTLSIEDFILDNPGEFDPKTVKKNNATDMIRSGARGNWDQYKQIAVEKGYISDVSGRVLPDPISHNLVDGLTPDEYFTTCYGGRKGLIDTADNTAKSGYLTRKLVYLLSPLHLTDQNHEEVRSLQFYVRDEQIAKMLIRRNTTDGKITEDNYKSIIGTTINLYSPITCSSLSICKKCYGDLYHIHKSDMVGLIAAQSLGERTTQLTLRTKHTSGATEDKTQFLKPFFDMKKGVWKAKEQGKFTISTDAVIFEIDNNEYELTGFEIFEPIIKPIETSENTYMFYDGQKIAKVNMATQDVVSAVTMLSSLLNNPVKDNEELSIQDFLYKIVDIYGNYATIDLVHFELIVSILCRSKSNLYTPYRMHPEDGYTFIGLAKAISMMPEQALAFERFSYHMKKYINDGVPKLDEMNEFSLLKKMMFI